VRALRRRLEGEQQRRPGRSAAPSLQPLAAQPAGRPGL
jgi:hypothetical protein